METDNRPKGGIIKNIYLYLVSFVALMMIVFSVADMVNIALRTYVFPKADDGYYGYGPICATLPSETSTSSGSRVSEKCIDEEEQKKRDSEMRTAQRQRDLVRDISMILVAVPVFAYHWSIVRRKEEV